MPLHTKLLPFKLWLTHECKGLAIAALYSIGLCKYSRFAYKFTAARSSLLAGCFLLRAGFSRN
jgi:hypothetical protein